MTPEDEALLARVPARRRDELRTALEELERVRRQYGPVRDEELPAEALARGRAAARIVHRATRTGSPFAHAAIGLLLVAVALGLALAAPVTFYVGAAAGQGELRCVVHQRPLGLVPWQVEEVTRVTSAEGESATVSRRTSDSNGKEKTLRVTRQSLVLQDAQGTTLYRAELEYGLGADLPELARRLQALARGEEKGAVVAWVTVWPALLGATLFGFVGLAMVWEALADRLRWSSHAALRGLAHPLVTRGIYLVALAIVVAAWVVAACGESSPAWLVALLGLSH